MANNRGEGTAPPTEAAPGSRERILEAAIEVFAEKGYAKTRVREIAERAGFTPGALYVHFPNRDALLTEAILHGAGRSVQQAQVNFALIDTSVRSLATYLAAEASRPGDVSDRLILEGLAVSSRSREDETPIDQTKQLGKEAVHFLVEHMLNNGALHPDWGYEAVSSFLKTWMLGTVALRASGDPTTDTEAYAELVFSLLGRLAEPPPGSASDSSE